jgi:opacity protein-like surface antigen
MKRRQTRAVLEPVLALVIVAMTGALSSSPLLAQETTTTTTTPQYHSASNAAGIRWEGWGPRVGVSFSPDQFWGGVHFNLGYFARDVRFRPTIYAGFGDHVTLITGMAEVHYIFSKVQVWKPYVGGGLGITFVNADEGEKFDDLSDTEIAFAAVGGVETKLHSGALMGFEGRIGIGDADPDVMLGVTWSFK